MMEEIKIIIRNDNEKNLIGYYIEKSKKEQSINDMLAFIGILKLITETEFEKMKNSLESKGAKLQ